MKIKLPLIFLLIFNFVDGQVPSSWSTTSTYTSGALVLDANGVTYIAQQDVNVAGTALTDTAYWKSLDAAAPTSAPSTSAPSTTPDTSTVPSTTPDTNDTSTTDDPDLPNAGSTDVVLRGISTAGFISSSSKLSGGFTISGGSMSVLATGKGGKEILSTGSFQDTLNDPTMEMKDLLTSTSLYTNNDWSTGSHVSQLTSTGFFNAYEQDDSGLYVTLNAGSYLADISSNDGDSGGSFVEVYNNYGFFEFDSSIASGKLTGISTNGIVNNGTEPGQRMSAAITIGNLAGTAETSKRIIVMAKYSLGVTSDHLEDPKLEVRNSSGTVIASNNDWSSNPTSMKNAITSTGLMTGYRDKDAAIILNVTAGSYFIDVYSQDGDSGGSLVEVYDLDLLESIYGWNLGN